MGILSPSDEATFQTLIEAKGAHFFGIISALPPAAVNFTRNSGNPQPRLDRQKWGILEKHGLPMVFLKFWENRGQPIADWGGPISNPNRG